MPAPAAARRVADAYLQQKQFLTIEAGARPRDGYHCINATRGTYATSARLSIQSWLSFMIQRRTDEQTALTAEYALYLVDIRGVEFALTYLDSCNVSRTILTRALQAPELRRHHERRQYPRND